MQEKGNVIQRVQGEKGKGMASYATLCFVCGILGLGLSFILYMLHPRNDSEIGVMVLLGALGVFLLVLGFLIPAMYSKGNLDKTFLEIRTDGITIQPLRGEQLTIPYKQVKNIQYFGGIAAQIIIESEFGIKASFQVKDKNTAMELCNFIQECKEKSI